MNDCDKLALCALSNSTVHAASFDVTKVPNAHHMTHTCEEEEVVNQKQTGTCWLQAGLTFLSSLARRRGLTIRFSLTHLVYYDKLGKAESFLRRMQELASEPDPKIRERKRWHLMGEPIGDGGTWGMFVHLIRKHGVVPHDARLPLQQATQTSQLNRYINDYLRHVAEDPNVAIETAVSKVETALRRAYGPPVSDATLVKRVHGCEFRGTPVELLARLRETWPYHVLTHAPDRREERGEVVGYIGPETNDPANLKQDRFVAVDMETLANACILQLEVGLPVWFTCDVKFDFCALRGVAARGLYNTELVLGLPRLGEKRDRMRARRIFPRHAMLLTAVSVRDGVPKLWRIQNSWGTNQEYGKGFLTVDHAWFCEYVFQAAIDHSFLGESLLQKINASRQIKLDEWDLFATVARG